MITKRIDVSLLSLSAVFNSVDKIRIPAFHNFQVHRLSDDAVTEDNKHLAAIKHSSKIVTKSTCNCGRVQEERSDPFDIKVTGKPLCCDELIILAHPYFLKCLVLCTLFITEIDQ